MNVDECCHQGKVACCVSWVSMNDEETWQANSAPDGVHLNLDVENTELYAYLISPYRRIFVYRDDSCRTPDSFPSLHSPYLGPNRGLASFLHHHGRYSLCAAKHDPSRALAPSLYAHRASKPCHPYAPKPFCLVPILSLPWGARHGGSTRDGCRFEKVRCRCLFLEANVVVVTGEGDNFCLCLYPVLCPCPCLVRGRGYGLYLYLCLCLCRRVGDGNGLVQPLAPADLHISCRL